MAEPSWPRLFDAAFAQSAMDAAGLPGPKEGESTYDRWLRVGEPARIVPTPHFHLAGYLAAYPDIEASGMFAFRHFLNFGLAEGRRPNPWFEEAHYRALAKPPTGKPAFHHFLETGLPAGFAPGTQVDAALYPSIIEAGLRWTHEEKLPAFELVVRMVNLLVYDGTGDLPPTATFGERLLHFVATGLGRGDPIGPLFDPDHYRNAAAAAGLEGVNDTPPLLHFARIGAKARIVPTKLFDLDYYRRTNQDLVRHARWAFAHFVDHGLREGRRPAPGLIWRLGAAGLAPPRGRGAARVVAVAGQTPPGPVEPGSLAGFVTQVRAVQDTIAAPSFTDILARAERLEPSIGVVADVGEILVPPYHDPLYRAHRTLRRRLARTRYDNILCMPWLRTGGADLVGATLTRALRRLRPGEHVLVLLTEAATPDLSGWTDPQAEIVGISDLLADLPENARDRLLEAVIRGTAARRVFNINSLLCWRLFARHAPRLARDTDLYAYIFCWDRTEAGSRTGYPSWFFAACAPSLTAVFTDSQILRAELLALYRLPARLRDRLVVLPQPPRIAATASPLAAEPLPARARPLVLWAGRLDPQKRFDRLVEVARLLPDMDFEAWGATVIGPAPDLTNLPANLRLAGPFDDIESLPLAQASGFLFTSDWEGMPNIVLEVAALGMALVANTVGGVPALVDTTTGWPVPPEAGPAGLAEAVADMIRHPEERAARGRRLQARLRETHSVSRHDTILGTILARARA